MLKKMEKNELLENVSKYKNFIFLIMCLIVHVFNVGMFFFLKLPILGIINIFSSLFYVIIVIKWKKESDLEIKLIYFEIICFCLISDLCTAGRFNYIYFVLGMIAIIQFLLSDETKKRYIDQGIGVIAAIILYIVKMKNFCIFPQMLEKIEPYIFGIGFINLCITLFTLVYVSLLYMVESSLLKRKLAYTSNHDTLTGLYNRRFFECTISKRYEEYNSEYSIAMIDLDDFKKVNDTYGHKAGDIVLENLSECINKHIPKNALPIRWGGEEFIIYMPNTGIKMAEEYLTEICNDLKSRVIECGCHKIKVTATVGIQSSDDASVYEKIIEEADERLYFGKKNGKNCIVCG